MTPASLRALADLLEADPSLEVRSVELGRVGQSAEARRDATNAERQRRHRDRRNALRNGVTLKSPQQDGSDLDLLNRAEKRPDSGSGTDQPVSKAMPVGLVLVESNALRNGVTSRGPVSRAPRRGPLWHFVPEGWQPNDKHRTLALGLLLDVDVEAAAFRDFEFKTPRSDPDRAFAGWLRRAPEMKLNRPAARRMSDHEAVFERSRRIQAEEAAKLRTIETKGVAAE